MSSDWKPSAETEAELRDAFQFAGGYSHVSRAWVENLLAAEFRRGWWDSGVVGDALVREILEAACQREGLPLESGVEPGEPARNYELAARLEIGHVFGLKGEPA